MKANSILPIRLSFFLFLLAFGTSAYAFELVCPPDETVGCNENIYDLSDFGNAEYKDYSGWHDAGYPTVEYNLNHCDQGTIVRTWTVLNPYANVYVSCSQVITVGDNSSFSENNISWPLTGLEVTGCNPDLSPSALPPGYQEPTWTADACAMIGSSYSDKVFTLSGACKKVVREWELINCCDFNAYTGHGIFKFYQEIDVIAGDLPSITCPSDITVETYDCTGGYVELPELTIPDGDCSDIVQISNDSPFASSGGANASGIYPIGTTEVTYIANYGCSTYPTVCKVNVTVIDATTPTPYCMYGVAIALMGSDTDGDGINDEGMVEVWASDLDKGSYASCDSEATLTFSFSDDPDDNVRLFTCDDVGRNDVEIWVTDEYGRQNYCNTYVRVQNNSANIEDCEDSDEYSTLSGHLKVHYGGHPGEVDVIAKGTAHQGTDELITEFELIEVYTDSFMNSSGVWLYFYETDTIFTETIVTNYPTYETHITSYGGVYTFEDLMHYHDYTIHVQASDESLSRVNLGDLVELRAYLEGIVEFTAYQKLAADMNGDGEITTADYALLQDIVNNVDGATIDTEWHFYDQAVDMENNVDEDHECEEFCKVMDLKEDTYKVNLVGYLLGDITDLEVAGVETVADALQVEEADLAELAMEYSITPNPFSSSIVLNLDKATRGEATFVLKNQAGNPVFTQEMMIDNGSNSVSIDILKPLTAGIYIYEVRTSTEFVTGKILKL